MKWSPFFSAHTTNLFGLSLSLHKSLVTTKYYPFSGRVGFHVTLSSNFDLLTHGRFHC